MSVQVKEADAGKSSQPDSLVETSNESEQTYSGTGFSIASESSKSGKFTPSLSPSNILNLQRTIGNRAVQRLIARERTGDSHQCTASCNHVQRVMAPTISKQSSQIQRHMGDDHDHEDPAIQRHMAEDEAHDHDHDHGHEDPGIQRHMGHDEEEAG